MRPSDTSQRRGGAAIEFAIAAPVLFLFVFATIEFCRLNVVYHTAVNAAYCATRAVIVPGADPQDARQRAEGVLQAAGILNAEIIFSPSVITEDTPFVSTQISIPIRESGWWSGLYCSNITIDAETTLRTERAPIAQAATLPSVLNPPPPENPPPSG